MWKADDLNEEQPETEDLNTQKTREVETHEEHTN